MTTHYRPKISSYSSENGIRDIKQEIERRRIEAELSRDALAKNIILPNIAKFQFAEYVKVDVDGNVNYSNISLEDLFSMDRDWWYSIRPAFPSSKVLKKELKKSNVKENGYEYFLRERFRKFAEEGLLEKTVNRKEFDLSREGLVFHDGKFWRKTGTREVVKSNIETRETIMYALKEGSDWYEMLRKILSHDNPAGIEFNGFVIGYNPYVTHYENLRPFYLDFNSKLERSEKFEERKAERRRRVIPELFLRLMRLHSNIIEVYKTATDDVVRRRSGQGFVTLRPPYILNRIVESLPTNLGAIWYNASELSDNYTLPWLEPLQEAVYDINSRESELRYRSKRFSELEKEDLNSRKIGKPDYTAVKNTINEIVDAIVPFAIDVENELERMLGYGNRTYVFT